jgi:hypothetical protein
MTTAPESVTLTCPVCGATEEAIGRGSVDISWVNNVLATNLNYNATAAHICPDITIPAFENTP